MDKDTTRLSELVETGDGQLFDVRTYQPPTQALIVAQENQTKALMALVTTLAPIANFFQGQTMASMLQARAKSEAVSAVVSKAIEKLGFDAQRFKTMSVEVPHLVDAIFDKIQERESEKRGPTIDAEEAFRKSEEGVE